MTDPFISAQINQQQINALNRRLDRFAAAMQNPTPANREASIAMYGFLIRNFDRAGGLQGGWAPLHPRTVREKARIGKERMLVRSGALRASFLPFHSRENAGVGSPLEYAKPLHEGAPSRNLPARELLPRRKKVLEIGVMVYGQYVAREARKANG